MVLPSGQTVEAEARAPPDLALVLRRIKDVVAVLEDFARRRAPGRSRADYMDQVRSGGQGLRWGCGGGAREGS